MKHTTIYFEARFALFNLKNLTFEFDSSCFSLIKIDGLK